MGFYCFLASALCFNVLLLVVHRSKQRIESIENKLFLNLAYLNCFGLLNELFLQYCIHQAGINEQSLFLDIVAKIYLCYLFSWFSLFTIYALVVSYKHYDKIKDFYNSIFGGFVILNCVALIVVAILPISIFYDGIDMYSFGAAVDFIKFSIVIFILVWIVSMITNYKSIRHKKYIPIIAIIILLILMVIVQMQYPEVLLGTVIGTFTCYLMFFTIENPDLKLINELNIAKEQAEKANNYKTEFLSSMSHEIRTPLNAIVGLSQALSSNENMPETAKVDVKDIIMASNILLEIVNGILDISKIEANKLEIINQEYKPKEMLNELVTLTKARMGDKVLDFRTDFDPSIPDVLFGDQARIKQIILNLLTNAIKYTKEGFVEFKVNSVVMNNVCRLIISIEDSGVGIKPEDINKLFNKFQRLNEGGTTSIEGTGLGLAITKRLTELMGGQIVVQSVFGKGSKFSVAINQRVIKVESVVEEKSLINTQEIKKIDFSNKRVLVVDDNNLNLKVAARMLGTLGLSPMTVNSGYECIEAIKNGQYYDLILLDDMMPNMSGVETLKKLKENPDFKIPVIALTANAIEGMREKYLESGFNDYLAKPIDKKELYRVLVEYLSNNK